MQDFSTVLLVDPFPAARSSLAQALSGMGLDVWGADDVSSALNVIAMRRPGIVATELKLSDGGWREVHDLVKRYCPATSSVVILTAHGSIASAVAALKAGVADFLVKPVSVEQLLRAAGHPYTLREEAPIPPLSLDRAIWELLAQAVECYGSIAAAARRLRVDRRSLRRMLQRTPPVV